MNDGENNRPVWRMQDEKWFLVHTVRNFGKSRAILFCPTAQHWLKKYIQSLDVRTMGFNDKPISEIQKYELKTFCYLILSKLMSRKK